MGMTYKSQRSGSASFGIRTTGGDRAEEGVQALAVYQLTAQHRLKWKLMVSVFLRCCKKMFVKSHSLVSFLPVVTAGTSLLLLPSANDQSSVWYE